MSHNGNNMFACLDGAREGDLGRLSHSALTAKCEERDRDKNSKCPKGGSTYLLRKKGQGDP